MSILALASLAASSAVIALLCLTDPKRRRALGLQAATNNSAHRGLVVCAAILPGLILAVAGDAAAFLLWLGGCAVIGWLITTANSAHRERR
ncbi:hypothetical protein ABVV53_00630 [Novosphingobium sp. RD2P27]|uniref:DUF3325 domain-containing protein n=1 Tax=Novosphingobium kalidii TaxID=3230299 RepID=A0ABV2CWZ7_9SPHN